MCTAAVASAAETEVNVKGALSRPHVKLAVRSCALHRMSKVPSLPPPLSYSLPVTLPVKFINALLSLCLFRQLLCHMAAGRGQ